VEICHRWLPFSLSQARWFPFSDHPHFWGKLFYNVE
jgi:hypothetical protein